MKKIESPAFELGKGIKYETCLVSEKQDIENALNLCYEMKKEIKKDVKELKKYLILTENEKYYKLKNCELPIIFCVDAVFADGFENCLKRLIKRLKEILIENEEISCLKVLRKHKKKKTNSY